MGLKYYANINYSPVSDLLIQAIIKTENHLMDFSDYIYQDCLYNGRITGAYNIFYQGGPIYHGTHVPVPVAQWIAESKYNSAFTEVMALAHFSMFIHELLNKDPYIFP